MPRFVKIDKHCRFSGEDQNVKSQRRRTMDAQWSCELTKKKGKKIYKETNKQKQKQITNTQNKISIFQIKKMPVEKGSLISKEANVYNVELRQYSMEM